MATETDGSEVLETTENTVTETVNETSEESPDDKINRLEREKTELDTKNKQLFERAKKAEEKSKETAPSNTPTLTTKDTLALVTAKIDPEDFDEIVEFAGYRKQSVADVLKDKTLQTILKDRATDRANAQASHVQGGSRGGAPKTSPEAILANASKGELPESDAGIAALTAARLARQKAKK